MQYIKGSFSFRLKDKLDVWQRSYTNHRITSPTTTPPTSPTSIKIPSKNIARPNRTYTHTPPPPLTRSTHHPRTFDKDLP
jgi:hypothetical protein